MVTRPVSVRLDVDGSRQALAELDRFGDRGKRSLQRIERAGAPASRGLRAVNAAALETDRSLGRVAERAGGLANVSRAVGPIGLALAVGVGGAIALAAAAKNAAAEIAAIGDAADRAGVAAGTFEKLQATLVAIGQEANLETALFALNKRIGEARLGQQEQLRIFQQLGVELEDTAGRARTFEEVFDDLADAISGIEDPALKMAFAQKLAEESGKGLVQLWDLGSDRLRELGDELERAEALFGGDVIRSAQALNAEFGVQAQILNVQLKTALVQVAPLVVGLTQAVIDQLPALIQNTAEWLKFLGVIEQLPIAFRIAKAEAEVLRREAALATANKEIAASESLAASGVNQPLLAFERENAGGARGRARAALDAARQELDALIAERDATAAALRAQAEALLAGTRIESPGGAGGGAAAAGGFERAIEQSVRQTAQLKLQLETLGESAAETARLRVETALLAAAEQEYGEALQTDAALRAEVNLRIAAAAELNARATEALEAATEAERRNEEAARNRAAAQEEAARRTEAAIEQVGATIEGVILSTENAWRRLLALALQSLVGTGPFGALINRALNVSAGGLLASAFGLNSSLAPTTSPLPPRPPGRAFGGEFTVPGVGGVDTVPMMLTPGERVRVMQGSARDPQGGGVTIVQNFNYVIEGGDEAGVAAALERARPLFARDAEAAALRAMARLSSGARGTAGRVILGGRR